MNNLDFTRKRKYAQRAAIFFAVIFLVIAFIITIVDNEINIEPKQETFLNASGSKTTYEVPSYSHRYELGKFWADLSFSLATALIVFLCIEQALTSYDKKQEKRDREENLRQAEELQQRIHNDVFDGVLQKLVPKEIFDVIATDILRKNLIRRNAIWEFTFENNHLNNGFLLTFVDSFEFENLADILL